ncbi:FadR/GntR family transcriptional regulator [Oceanomicrobium pacificus]|uniref:FCD domain-containing protein n=1 Tax=Oceanomicrobium pacificus TaxID=2692916 RepID=A0A6B0TT95_9RHOB|nr:FadR/GntR family transcriptional regulator [Oceanomicrobium pacificus]MXU65025.1 FCD domain-containing protein [Oceanomicrobium pacificus]
MAETVSLTARSGLSWQIASAIGTRIVNGEYAPGDVLPTESDLGEAYNVGRSAVREAIKMLASKGLVDARPRRGTIVCERNAWSFLDADLLSWLEGSAPDQEFLLELVDMRMAIETEAAALAAGRSVAQEVKEIRAAYEKMVAAEIGQADPIAADLEFHKAIVSASGNRFMRPLVAIVSTALRFSFRYTNALAGAHVGDLEEHERILLAIEAGDAEGARAAVRSLLQSVRDAVERGGQKNSDGLEQT